MGTDRWAWAADSRYPGFCLTFVEDRTPAAVVTALGADPALLEVLTGPEAELAYPITEPGSLLRCGPAGRWTFCYEDRAPVANRPPAIARLSAGTAILQVAKGGDGMTIVRHVADGGTVELFEPLPGATATGDGPYQLLPLVERVLATRPGITGTVAALHVVGARVGVVLDREVLDGPLPTAITTLAEPAAPRPPYSKHSTAQVRISRSD